MCLFDDVDDEILTSTAPILVNSSEMMKISGSYRIFKEIFPNMKYKCPYKARHVRKALKIECGLRSISLNIRYVKKIFGYLETKLDDPYEFTKRYWNDRSPESAMFMSSWRITDPLCKDSICKIAQNCLNEGDFKNIFRIGGDYIYTLMTINRHNLSAAAYLEYFLARCYENKSLHSYTINKAKRMIHLLNPLIISGIYPLCNLIKPCTEDWHIDHPEDGLAVVTAYNRVDRYLTTITKRYIMIKPHHTNDVERIYGHL